MHPTLPPPAPQHPVCLRLCLCHLRRCMKLSA
jgi:hypothetical protein